MAGDPDEETESDAEARDEVQTADQFSPSQGLYQIVTA
jgi:hypothetical protein